jgi:hypothetical protein
MENRAIFPDHALKVRESGAILGQSAAARRAVAKFRVLVKGWQES